jgi:hypothetical protein
LPGFVFKILSIIMVFFLGLSRKFSNVFYKFLCVFLGIALYLAVKLPLSYVIWTKLFDMSEIWLQGLMFTVVFYFNLIKCILNYVLALLLLNPVKRILNLFKPQ